MLSERIVDNIKEINSIFTYISDSKKDIVKNGNLSENDCIHILYKNTNMNIRYGLNIANNYTTITIQCHSKEICDEFVTDANKFYKNKNKKKSLIIVLFMLFITCMSFIIVLVIP